MVRVAIKSGVWKNSEDETLKAAIQKYGQVSQWGRIATLLPRKTARQCRARWENWLDPRLRKTEWTREEDERLLHLAKLMPTQWRTIAPLIGRTAGQCLERYGRLLDQAAGGDRDREEEEVKALNKLRVGDIDPNPEDKPARPDPVDMDEDEKEMLSEAKARLANVSGKKAKRKARERLLENARRMAKLQRYRELKAAGLTASTKAVFDAGRDKADRNGIDHANEIPFERSVPAGFYRTEAEIEQGAQQLWSKESKKRLLEVANEDPHKRAKVEREAMTRDRERFEKLARTNMEAAMKVIDERNNAFAAVTSRAKAKLLLPSPQVTDAELEHIAKMGRQAENSSSRSSSSSSNADLVGEYAAQALSMSRAAEQVRTPVAPDVVMEEARNQKVRTAATTPLVGGDNAAIAGGTGFEGYTPSVKSVVTPSVAGMATSKTGGAISGGGSIATGFTLASRASSIGLRDHFSINREEEEDEFAVEAIESHEEQKARRKKKLEQLKAQLGSLPAPKYSYDFEVSGGDNDSKNKTKSKKADNITGEEDDEDVNIVLDAADEEAMAAARVRAVDMARLESRTNVAKHGLPCPTSLQPDSAAAEAYSASASSESERLLYTQALRLAEADANDTDPPTQESAPAEHHQAEALIAAEVEALYGIMFRDEGTARAVGQALLEARSQVIIVPGAEWQSDGKKKSKTKTKQSTTTVFGPPFTAIPKATASDEQHLAAARLEFFAVETVLAQRKIQQKKLSKRATLLVAGLEARVDVANKGFIEASAELERAERERETFRHMQAKEQASVPLRLHVWRERAAAMRAKEQRLQAIFFETVN